MQTFATVNRILFSRYGGPLRRTHSLTNIVMVVPYEGHIASLGTQTFIVTYYSEDTKNTDCSS